MMIEMSSSAKGQMSNSPVNHVLEAGNSINFATELRKRNNE